MVRSICENCQGHYHWNWREAFMKFGFNDGDGQVETFTVASILQNAGYIVEYDKWGLHNVVILSLKKGTDGSELIPHNSEEVCFGYDEPETYLPSEIVELLERELSPETILEF